ncbi:MAG: ATP-binding protein [Natronomonas sp.]
MALPARLLYVDGDPVLRAAVTEYLEASGEIRVTERPTIEEAIERLSDGDVDCVATPSTTDRLPRLIDAVESVSEETPVVVHPPEPEAAQQLPDADSEQVAVAPQVGTASLEALEDRVLETISPFRVADHETTRAIVDALEDPVYVLDEQGRFVRINDAFVELTGYEMEAILGSHVSLIKTPEMVRRSEDALRGVLRSDTTEEGLLEVEITTAGGETVLCEDHMGLLPMPDGEFRGSVGVLRDITEQKSRKADLERKNERLESFASIVSHDLRSPLTVAAGNISLAADECESEYLPKAADALDRMEELIDNLLRLARNGEVVEATDRVDLETTVTRAWASVESDAASLSMQTDLTVTGDETRLTDLFVNLFRNSVEHSSTDNRPEADDSVEHSSTSNRPGADVTITVGALEDRRGFYIEDTGPGIPPGEREAVFEPGYSTSEDGTGFGLSIVREIVTAHGWEISVTSGADGGARFEITGIED